MRVRKELKYSILPILITVLLLFVSCEKSDKSPDNNNVTPNPLEPGLLVDIENVNPSPVYCREGQLVELEVRLFNHASKTEEVNITLILPDYITPKDQDTLKQASIGYSREVRVTFNVTSLKATKAFYEIKVDNGEKFNSKTFMLEFRPPYEGPSADYVPYPESIETNGYLLGAFRCPLWYEKTRPDCWKPIQRAFPERAPVLGFYNEANPEVIDWEIKYAVEHGISFFVDCWYRDKNNEGKSPVEARLDHWVQNLKDARYKEMIKFALLWENTNNIASGIASEEDLLQNLLPYWIDTYFSESNYMTIDGKPLLYVYGYNKFIDQLGGRENTKTAIAKMNQALIDKGFSGIHLVAVHNLNFRSDLSFLEDIGFESVGSYHVPTFTGEMNSTYPPVQSEIVRIQELCWNKLKNASAMPTYPVISMGWDSEPWGFAYSKGQWAITGDDYLNLCEKARNFSEYLPEGNRIIMLDNWNEFGEGHYISPTQKYGFEHLDALRETFSSAGDHIDIVPEDVNLGPYEYPIGE